jgi:hypothetical protein
MKKVKDISHFIRLINTGHQDFAISLNGLCSSKECWPGNHGRITVLNNIDGTQQSLTPRQLYTQSNIGEAITKGAFYVDEG